MSCIECEKNPLMWDCTVKQLCVNCFWDTTIFQKHHSVKIPHSDVLKYQTYDIKEKNPVFAAFMLSAIENLNDAHNTSSP